MEALFLKLREQNREHLFRKSFVHKKNIFVVDFSYDDVIFGFDIELDDDGLLRLSFVQRNAINEIGFLLSQKSKNQLLAERMSEFQVLVMICSVLSLTINKIDGFTKRPPPAITDTVLGAEYTIYENAIVVPPRLIRPEVFDNAAGVFTANGDYIDDCVTYSVDSARHKEANFPGFENIPILSGTHCYGGVFFGHFGHFITESTGRLWPLGVDELNVQSVVYVPKSGTKKTPETSSKEDILRALGMTANISVVIRPVVVERLIVPKPGFGLTDKLIDGTPQYVNYMRKVSINQPAPAGAEKLYISRQGLPHDRGSFLGEAFVEELLEAEGYLIWSPQKHSAAEQIAQYRAAKMIISVDASPLHMYAYAARNGQKLAIIKRRSTDAYTNIVRHINAFNNPEIHILDELIADHIPASGRVGRSSWGEVDIGRIGAALARIEMINEQKKWEEFNINSIKEQIETLSSSAGTRYHRQVAPSRMAEVKKSR